MQRPPPPRDKISRRRFIGGLAVAALIQRAGVLRFPPSSADTGRKRIYLAADDHTDYFWTADGETYRRAFLEMLDYYLDLADATEEEPAEHQSRWNCDGSVWLWTYEKNKPQADFERLIGRIKDGHVSAPLNALVVCLGGAPTEAVLRGFYYAGHLERRYDLRFVMAVAMENQTLPYGLSALWAGSGAKYSWKGICACATRVEKAGDREHDMYWMVGPDGSRVLMKWYALMAGDNRSIGGYAEARDPGAVVEFIDKDPAFTGRYPYSVIGAFGQGWDDLDTLNDAVVRAAKEKTDERRMVIVSNQVDFFEDFERTYGADLPSVSCSFGNEWDVYCTSMAEVSARVKRAVEALRGAEALATLISLHDPSFMDGHRTARDQAWMAAGLYWEHGWVADGPVGRDLRAGWQRDLAAHIESYTYTLRDAAAAALAGMIKAQSGRRRFYAFNPLGWTRTDLADVPHAETTPVHVIDLTTGRETPSQIVIVDGERRLRVLARDVPSVGYKVFEIREGRRARFADAARISRRATRLENEFYRIAVAGRGAITSLVDKRRGRREFARKVGGRFLNDLGAGGGMLRVENAGPVSVTLLATASGPLRHTTRITLIRSSPRIDIRNDITQNFADVHTWGFGFAMDSPDVWHEEVGAVIRARLTTDGGHYSPRNARYDWLTLNHFADISGGGAGVTLSNADCYFFRLGSSTAQALDRVTPQISALAGGQVDGPSYGIPSQGGDAHFLQRFALQTHDGFDPTASMRIALEHQNPLITAFCRDGDVYPEASYSFLAISDPRALLWALKPAEDGIARAGVVARLWNVSDAAVACSLRLGSRRIAAARRTSHIETDLEPAPVHDGMLPISLAARQMQTYSFTVGDDP